MRAFLTIVRVITVKGRFTSSSYTIIIVLMLFINNLSIIAIVVIVIVVATVIVTIQFAFYFDFVASAKCIAIYSNLLSPCAFTTRVVTIAAMF